MGFVGLEFMIEVARISSQANITSRTNGSLWIAMLGHG